MTDENGRISRCEFPQDSNSLKITLIEIQCPTTERTTHLVKIHYDNKNIDIRTEKWEASNAMINPKNDANLTSNELVKIVKNKLYFVPDYRMSLEFPPYIDYTYEINLDKQLSSSEIS